MFGKVPESRHELKKVHPEIRCNYKLNIGININTLTNTKIQKY